ncbi:MAG: hypothetical protein OEM15_12060 [Myxococcales bacterium]|nr:hypothetical protein [Myxococcales bacterium]MDH3484463.1 hypothetical protein [Myxococcales bacterium]
MSLDATARRRYARQLLLSEIGEAGQERLCGAGFRRGVEGDADAYAVAAEYLRRAGCLESEGEGASVRVATTEAVMHFAGKASLRAPAVAVIGAFAAVEHLKEALGVGQPHAFPSNLTLQPKRGQSPFSRG